DAEAEEQADCQLLRPSHGEVDPDQEAEARDEQDEAPAVRQIAAEGRTKGEEAAGDGHEAHRLAEERAGLVARDCGLNSRVDGAHELELRFAPCRVLPTSSRSSRRKRLVVCVGMEPPPEERQRRRWFHQRSDPNAARSSCEKSSGSSQAAK